ncbi:MAG: radical SAM protein, partial [Spirochaetaceae bacterium]|nr:radical SAM protein [Spirochaetaceae bacterium]
MKRRSRLIARKSICIPDSLSEGQIVIPGVARDIANPDWEEAGSHILIVRLSPWADVEISTSHLVLFSETRESQPDAYIDFAFLPSAPDRQALSRAGYPWFFGRQSRKSPAEFNLVMISNAFGLELVNLSHFYSTSNLPGSAVQRAGMDGMPVIIMGGSNASAMGSIVQMSQARGPASDALVDGIFFGEGEGAIGELSLILTGRKEAAARGQRSHDSAAARRRRLEEAARIKGFWPCLLGEAAEKAVAGKRPSPVSHTLVLNGPNALVTKLAITSGCPGYCSFCMEGWDRRPYAEADVDEVLRQARELRARTGADTLELYSFNFNTHSRIFELIYELNRIFPHVSLMSQRLDILSDTRGLFEAEVSAGKRSFTFGIEGVSTRMRSYYHKGISAQQIGNCLDIVIRSGARELKLFFIIAGFEDSDDVDEFSTLMQAIREKKKAAMASTRVLVSAGFLVRLPFTPLQYAPLAFDENRLSGLSSSLATCCQANGIEYRTAVALDEYFVDQTISLSGGILFPW